VLVAIQPVLPATGSQQISASTAQLGTTSLVVIAASFAPMLPIQTPLQVLVRPVTSPAATVSQELPPVAPPVRTHYTSITSPAQQLAPTDSPLTSGMFALNTPLLSHN